MFHSSARRSPLLKFQVIVSPLLSLVESQLFTSSSTSKFNAFPGYLQSFSPVRIFSPVQRPYRTNLMVPILLNAISSCLCPSFVQPFLISPLQYVFSPFSAGIKIIQSCLLSTLCSRVNSNSLTALFLPLFRTKFSLAIFFLSNIFFLRTSVLLSSVCGSALSPSLGCFHISR